MASAEGLLLDTHLLVWAAYDPTRLSARAARLIEARASPVVFSLVSLWEAAIKSSLGRSDFAVEVEELHRALLAEGFVALPITPSHITRVGQLPWLHRDPFDRMLVAQAMTEDLTLLTADKTLKAYGRFVRAV